MLLSIGGCHQQTTGPPTSAIIELTDANFQSEVLESQEPVLVEFWAPWCQPCVEMMPSLEQVAEEFAGRAIVGKVRIDEHELVASHYGIEAPPTIVVFRSGRLVKRRSGLQSMEALRALLDAALASTPEVTAHAQPKVPTGVRILDE